MFVFIYHAERGLAYRQLNSLKPFHGIQIEKWLNYARTCSRIVKKHGNVSEKYFVTFYSLTMPYLFDKICEITVLRLKIAYFGSGKLFQRIFYGRRIFYGVPKCVRWPKVCKSLKNFLNYVNRIKTFENIFKTANPPKNRRFFWGGLGF